MTSSESKDTGQEVKADFPKVETPFDRMTDDIKPHSSIRQVSATQ